MSEGNAPSGTAVDPEGGHWVTATIERGHYRTVVRARDHTQVLDEPAAVGGADTGPSPYDALLGALAGCTAITLRMYADRKGWPLEAAHVHLRTSLSHGEDCERCESADVGPHRLERRVDLEGPLTPEQRDRMLRIADRCPVKQTLERGVRVVREGT